MPGYRRDGYIRFLLQNKDKEQVKILSGLRGSGKTSVFRAYMEELKAAGVPEERIVYYDMSDPDTHAFFPVERLFRLIFDRFPDGRRTYIFLDEIQELPEFERLVDRLFRIQNYDLYIAGSGLSSRLDPLKKLLPGRCMVKEVFPLSFTEFLTGSETAPTVSSLLDYTEYSSMPGVHDHVHPRDELDPLISSALFHEVTSHPEIRQGLLLKILGLISPRSGELLSMETLGKAAGRAGRPLLLKTLTTYTKTLEAAGLLLACPLIPIEGEEPVTCQLSTYRFFFPDPAMMLLFGKGDEYPYRQLFTATAAEMHRRTEALFCGETLRGPVDFVTGEGAFRTLWQFIPNPEAAYAEEKWNILQSAPKNIRKCVLTLAPESFDNVPGITVQHLFTWFMMGGI